MLSATSPVHCAVSADTFRARIGSLSHGFSAFLSNPNFLLKVSVLAFGLPLGLVSTSSSEILQRDQYMIIQCKQ